VGDAVLAAQEHAAQVDVLHALPGIERRLDHGAVLRGGDAGVVEQHVDSSELLEHARVHVGHLLLVGHVYAQ